MTPAHNVHNNYRLSLNDSVHNENLLYIKSLVHNKIRAIEQYSVTAGFWDFFPTPRHLCDVLVDLARIEPGMLVLEPSAGKGDIAKVLRDVDANVNCIEIQPILRTLLALKGFRVVGDNALQHRWQYPRIVANPPFSRFITHIKHYYNLLTPGGRLVSIAPESIWMRCTPHILRFHDWLDSVDSKSFKLPDGSFLYSERPTNVATRVLTIDKLS